eukprot:scaffold3587_cov364-Prasinococcus_capsulatus_cf.AAC.1
MRERHSTLRGKRRARGRHVLPATPTPGPQCAECPTGTARDDTLVTKRPSRGRLLNGHGISSVRGPGRLQKIKNTAEGRSQ